jgi:hypothetical protein
MNPPTIKLFFNESIPIINTRYINADDGKGRVF